MRAGQHGHAARAGERRVESCDRRSDPGGFRRFVVVADDLDQSAVRSGGLDRIVVIDGPERAGADVHDLGRAPVVDREPHHLDSGKPIGHLAEDRWVGAVEAVDRLRGVADQEQVVGALAEQLDEPMLERIEVLCLVDENVAEPPSGRRRELGVGLHGLDRERKQIIQVDDPPLPLLAAVGRHGIGDPVDIQDRSAITATHGRVVGACVDAPSRCPVELGDQLVDVGRTHDLTHDPLAIGHDRAGLFVEIGPSLAQQLLGDRVKRPRCDSLGQAEPGESTAQFAGRFAGEGQHHGVAGIGRPVAMR